MPTDNEVEGVSDRQEFIPEQGSGRLKALKHLSKFSRATRRCRSCRMEDVYPPVHIRGGKEPGCVLRSLLPSPAWVQKREWIPRYGTGKCISLVFRAFLCLVPAGERTVP